MHPKRFALIGGIIMLATGILAFIAPLSADPLTAGLPVLNVETSYGYFLNFLALNVINKLVLIAFGIAGIWVSQLSTTALPASIQVSRWVLYVMAPLAILGMFARTDTLFGYMPLFGADVWVHGIFAALGAYFGFYLPYQARKNDEWLTQDRAA